MLDSAFALVKSEIIVQVETVNFSVMTFIPVKKYPK